MRVEKAGRASRSQTRVAGLALGLALTLVLLTAGLALAMGLVNGGFETGDLTGWTSVPDPPTGFISVENSHTTYDNMSNFAVITPVQGQFYALLKTGDAGADRVLTQEITPDANNTVNCASFFDSQGGHDGDVASIVLVDVGAGSNQMIKQYAADGGYTTWAVGSPARLEAGKTYRLEAHIKKARNGGADSYLGLDACQYGTPSANRPGELRADVNGDQVSLVWPTGSVANSAGFNVYRATAPDGKYGHPINNQLIRATGEAPDGVGSYLDQPGYGVFYYKLEDVDNAGNPTLHDQIRQVRVTSPFRRPASQPIPPKP